jgi:hypothetical protein
MVKNRKNWLMLHTKEFVRTLIAQDKNLYHSIIEVSLVTFTEKKAWMLSIQTPIHV